MVDRRSHWETVYATRPANQVSWFQTSAAASLRMIDATGADPNARLVDVGGGASCLAGELLQRGWAEVTVLDIAEPALDVARAALGSAASRVEWLAADVLDWRPATPFDIWHDRAVFHFLTEAEQQGRYLGILDRALKAGGWAIMGTFAPDGPEQCSGLAVQRWSAEALAAEFGAGFALRESFDEAHHTPGGANQNFSWALLQRL